MTQPYNALVWLFIFAIGMTIGWCIVSWILQTLWALVLFVCAILERRE